MMAMSTGELDQVLVQVVRLKRMTGAALLLALASFIVAATPAVQSRIDAQDLTIRDENGAVRARLDKQGLVVNDSKGNPRAQILLAGGTSSLILYGQAESRLQLAVSDDGIQSLYLMDDKMRERARLTLQKNDAVGLTFFDKSFKWRAMTSVTSAGTPSFTLYDDDGKVIAQLPPKSAR